MTCPLPLAVKLYFCDTYVTSERSVPVRAAAARSVVKRICLCGSLAHINVIDETLSASNDSLYIEDIISSSNCHSQDNVQQATGISVELCVNARSESGTQGDEFQVSRFESFDYLESWTGLHRFLFSFHWG